MSDTLRATCPNCKMPEQLPDLPCGFCNRLVPVPKGAVNEHGAVVREVRIGWKGMRVVRVKGKARLQSPVFGQHDGPWEPGEWKVAVHAGGHPQHTPDNPDVNMQPPVNKCMCGYYSGRTREHQMALGYSFYSEDNPHVMVEIQLAGKVIPASNGWRAQKVRPLTIYVPHEFWELARDLKAEYGPHGVEVKLDTTIILPKEAVPEWCPKCTAKWEGRGTTCKFCNYTLNG